MRCYKYNIEKMFIGVMFVLPLLLPWCGARNDLSLYHTYAVAMLAGRMPYRDVPIEYPPLTLILFVLPAVLTLVKKAYMAIFVISMGLWDIGQKWLLWRFSKHSKLLLLVLTAGNGLLYYTYLKRFDVVPAALVSFACVALIQKPAGYWPWVYLALGFCVKMYPAIIMPVALLYSLKHGAPWRTLVCQCCVALGVIVFIFGSMYALAGVAVFDPLLYQQQRGLHIATNYTAWHILQHGIGTIFDIELGFGTLQVGEAWGVYSSHLSAILMPVVFVLGLVASFGMLAQPLGLWCASAAAVVGMLLTSKVLSPQFIVWLIPLVSMVIMQVPSKLEKAIGIVLMLSICAFTSELFPSEISVSMGSVARQYSIIARLFAMIILWVYLLRPSRMWDSVYVRKRLLG